MEDNTEDQIEEFCTRFFNVRDVQESQAGFSEFRTICQSRIIDKLISKAIESKEADARLVGDLFSELVANELCSQACFEEGFMPTAEWLDDIVIDCPRAFELMVMMMRGSALDKDWHCYSRIAARSKHNNDFVALLLWKPV